MARDDRRADEQAKVPELAWLRRVVTGLALAMGLGIVALVAILWLRLSQPPLPDLPAALRRRRPVSDRVVAQAELAGAIRGAIAEGKPLPRLEVYSSQGQKLDPADCHRQRVVAEG